MQIVISGNISDDEILELQNEFVNEGLSIDRMNTKSNEITEGIHLIFRNFEIIDFVRDSFLDLLLANAFKKIKSIIFRLKDKNIASLRFELRFKKRNGKIKVVNFSCEHDVIDEAVLELNKILNSELIENFADNKVILITFKNNKIEIQEI